MAYQILLNVILALIWMFLTTKATPAAFIIGYLIGLIIMYIFRRFFSTRFYMHRAVAMVKLLLIFIRELFVANFDVFKIITRPKLELSPGIFSYETELTAEWQITLLANLITLTPGTLVIDISPDNKVLYIHSMNIGEIHEMKDAIKNSFEKAILEVTE